MDIFEELVLQEYRKSMSQLQTTWEEIGLDQSNCKKRVECVVDRIRELLSGMVEEETKFKKRMMADIEKYAHQFYNLNKDLEAGIEDPADSLSLLELEEFLRQNVKLLMIEAKKRQTQLKELRNQEQELCERLIEEPSDPPSRKIPSKEDMEDLERRIRTLEQEKISREKTFHHLQGQITEMLESLEQKPNCSFERDILSGVDLFTLSQQNLQRMKEIKVDLEMKVKENEKESVSLREQIERLWKRLEVTEEERDDFIARVGGYAPSTLVKLHEELNRLKLKQHQDLAKFINRLRREIEDWWEKCYIGEEERNAFTSYSAAEYTEEILLSHDMEVQRLSKYHSDCKVIFEMLEKRKQLWLKFIDLEEKANDPNRFGNRGGSLLREEKQRKTVRKELPMIEKELERLIHNWETQKGISFFIMGMKISDYINNEWLKYNEKKENERKKKHSERNSQLQYESIMGTKPPAVKRRIAGNDNLRKSKLQRVSEDHPLHITSSANSNTTKRMALRERNQNSIQKDVTAHTSSDVSTYSHFAEGIQRRSERENMRSSAASGIHKSAMSICRPSPKRPPSGLLKTPKSLPRPPTRYSPRLNGTASATKSARRSSSRTMTSSRIAFSPSSLSRSRNTTARVNFSPASSPLFRSPRRGSKQSSTPSKWNKLTFLI